MELFALGVSHRTAPVEQREKASLSGGRACSLLQALGLDKRIGEAVALSTCNRTEIYAAADSSGAPAAALAQALVATTRIGRSELDRISYALRGADVTRHLLRVAASLDSMVIGESEIQGQVRSALHLAEAHGTAGPYMRDLFRRALIVGKSVRRRTGIGHGAVSVSSVAVELAREVIPELASGKALLIGAGHVAEATAGALVGEGVGVMTVANRSVLAAEELADRFGGRGVPLAALGDELSTADIVICSTDAPHPILTVSDMREAMKQRGDRPVVLIDIAVPRDVEAGVQGLAGVTLLNIDDLDGVVQRNLTGRLQEARLAERIVEQELARVAALSASETRSPLRKHEAAVHVHPSRKAA